MFLNVSAIRRRRDVIRRRRDTRARQKHQGNVRDYRLLRIAGILAILRRRAAILRTLQNQWFSNDFVIRGLRDVIRRRCDTRAPQKYQGIVRVYRLLRIAGILGILRRRTAILRTGRQS